MKKTVLLVIDALASAVIRPALEGGGLPHFAQLVQRGDVRWNSTAVFPSITPAATSSICTGRYPADHGILGVCYFDQEEDRIYYYGTDIWVILREGFSAFFDEVVLQLNHRQLQTSTLFQLAEKAGLDAASVNYLLFRGDHKHEASTPWLLRLLPGMPHQETFSGPSVLCVGDFVSQRKDLDPPRDLKGPGGMKNRFGFCDETTGALMLQLAEQGLPEFTLGYFPNNDFDSHERGPLAALETVKKIDAWLGEFSERLGGMDQMLAETAIFITGDHSQTDVVDDQEQAGIEVGKLLEGVQIAKTGASWEEGDQVMICPNLRAAQVYLRNQDVVLRDRLIPMFLKDARVDQAIWCDRASNGDPEKFYVATADRGCCSFWRSDDSSAVVDDYGQTWQLEGDFAAIDAQLDGKHVTCPDYPNALERIALSFDRSRSGDIWVTARVGYEFADPGAELHGGGGSHGSLHVGDSTSPLIAAGLPTGIELPANPRSVDLAPLILKCLGVKHDELVLSGGHARS